MAIHQIIVFKAIPDTKLTIQKYLDAKFEYLVGNKENTNSNQNKMFAHL